MNTPRRHTLNDLVDFAYYNRRGKAFIRWSRDDIANAFIQSLQEGALAYTTDAGGNVNGVVHGYRFPERRVLFVANILGKGSLQTFCRHFHHLFPGWTLEANRHGKRVVYHNTKQLINKVVGVK